MSRAIATIKDVAREAGVSISTVSAVVNGNKPVSAELVNRVREAIGKLGFHPNHLARSMNAKRTRTLAYLTPDITNVAFLRTFKAVESIARARGYTVFLLGTDGSVEMTRNVIDRVIGLKMDGVFFTLSWALAQPDVNFRQLVERGIGLVGVSGSYDLSEIDCFLHDEEGAGHQFGDYLQRLGHGQVLCIGPTMSRSAERRWGGLQASYRDGVHHSADGITIAQTGGYTAKSGYDAVQAAVASRVPFTAMVAFNDAIATGALAALADNAMSVPNDVSFVSFGDGHRDFSRPQITSMTFEEEKIAELAGNRLIDRIEGTVGGPPIREYLPLKLSIRPSSRQIGKS